MIPIRDDTPVRGLPVVTPLLMLMCMGVYLWLLSLSPEARVEATRLLGFLPGVLFRHPEIEVEPWVSAPGSIFTAMFLHSGFFSLAVNMLYLWIFGDNVEDRFGHGPFTVFYLLCGLGATALQLAFSSGSHVPNLGASGAIAGVLGAYLLLFPQGRVRVLQYQRVVQMPALIVIGFWIVLQLFAGVGSISNAADTGGVAYMAHIGGFVVGCVLTLVFRGSGRAQVTA